MKQQINLLRSAKGAKGGTNGGGDSAANTVLMVFAGFALLVAGLIALTWHTQRQVTAMDRQLTELGKQREALTATQDALVSQAAERQPDPYLNSILENLKEEKKWKSRLLDYPPGNVQLNNYSNGFSIALEGLAQHTVDGIWLEEIVIDDDGSEIKIGGGVLLAETVPGFIRALQSERFFRGREFSFINIRRQTIREVAEARVKRQPQLKINDLLSTLPKDLSPNDYALDAPLSFSISSAGIKQEEDNGPRLTARELRRQGVR